MDTDLVPDLLARAAGATKRAFGELVAPYRHELQVHCYRILGSFQDAEDVLQETLLSAWRGLGGFEERSSVRTWLYRIATNRSLDSVRAGARREPEVTPPVINGRTAPEPSRYGEVPWLTPYPDVLLDLPDPAPGPEAVVETLEATSLAFVTALQLLPPRQRAVLILRDVLGYRAAEVAELLDSTVESVTSALKRARATLESDPTLAERRERPPAPDAGLPEERRLIDAYVDAFATHDVSKLVAILSDDVWLKMPPLPFEYHGPRRRHRVLRGDRASPGADAPLRPHPRQRLPRQRDVRPRPGHRHLAGQRADRGRLRRRPGLRDHPLRGRHDGRLRPPADPGVTPPV